MLKISAYAKARSKNQSKPRRFSAGMSIIELMIGLAIGLFILAGASAMFVNNVVSARQILLESRINQELRSAMDLITRDLRRGGYWGNAISGTLTAASNSTATPNPYSAITRTGTNQIEYAYTAYKTGIAEDNTVDAANEQFGFKLEAGTGTKALQMRVGGAWQALTNTDMVNITNFTFTPTETAIDISAACEKPCTTNCPVIQVRTYNIVLSGQSTANAAVTRTLRSQVRVRNDAISGACPA